MEFPVLILLHVAFGILWAGGAVLIGLFIVPSILDAGPAGGAVMAGIIKRRMPAVLTVAAALVVLTGVRLYMLRYSLAWLMSLEGLVLTFGAMLALGAFGLAVFVQKPAASRLAALGVQVAMTGGAPDAAQAAELRELQAKLRHVARLVAWHLVGASLLMASHRLAAML
jgi:uncharacterized membrane protein